MEEFAKKLINDHKNPLVKVELPGSKLLLKSSTANEEECVIKHQNTLKKIYQHDRVERRCARAQAIWIPEKNLAKVSKVVKSLLKYFGHQDKLGIFLTPEEMLFLLETNRLEILHKNVPLSIQETYEIVINTPSNSLTKYRVYKKLVLQGYKLLRKEELNRRQGKLKQNLNVKTSDKKREANLDFEKQPINKKSKPVEAEEEIINLDASTSDNSDIFEKLRQNSPRKYKRNINLQKEPDYFVFFPTNTSKVNFDFNLYICTDLMLENENYNEDTTNVFAVCSGENISFYKFYNVVLPHLI